MRTSLTTKDHQKSSPPIITNDSIIAISRETHIAAMKNSVMSSKYALQIEIAVGFAVYAESGRTDRQAKRDLTSVYSEAGYECLDHTQGEYKTVSRRINAIAALYEYVGADTVREWIGGTAEMMLINSVVSQISQLNLRSIDAVLAYAGKPRLASNKTHAELLENVPNRLLEGENHIREIPSEEASGEAATEGEAWPWKTAAEKAAEAALSAEATQALADKQPLDTSFTESSVEALSTQPEQGAITSEKASGITSGEVVTSDEGVKHIRTEHLDIIIPKVATKKDLTDAINALMAMIAAMDAPEEDIIKDTPVEAAAPAEPEIVEPEEPMPEDISHESPPLYSEAPTIKVEGGRFKQSRYKKGS